MEREEKFKSRDEVQDIRGKGVEHCEEGTGHEKRARVRRMGQMLRLRGRDEKVMRSCVSDLKRSGPCGCHRHGERGPEQSWSY